MTTYRDIEKALKQADLCEAGQSGITQYYAAWCESGRPDEDVYADLSSVLDCEAPSEVATYWLAIAARDFATAALHGDVPVEWLTGPGVCKAVSPAREVDCGWYTVALLSPEQSGEDRLSVKIRESDVPLCGSDDPDDADPERDYGNADWPSDAQVAEQASYLLGRQVSVRYYDRGDTLLEGIYRVASADE